MVNQYTNTVPRGAEGTGAASIFGANRALSYFVNEINKGQQKIDLQQQEYQKRQQGYNTNFQKDIYELGELANTPMYSQDFNNLTTTLMKQGGELMAQGVNPYNPNQSPESREAVMNWQSSVNKLRSAKTSIDNIHKQRADLIKNISNNPLEYDQEELKQLYDFEKNYTLDDIIKGQGLPQVSKNFDINAELVKELGEIKTEGGSYGTDENGNTVYRDFTQADTGRIVNTVNSRFNDPGSPYYQAVNKRLRREFGEGADVSGLIGITDKSELRRVIDGEFRNNDQSRQLLAELKTNGRNVDYDSPEYNELLDKAVEEQYKAETFFDKIRQDAANALIGKVNTKEKTKFDFSLRDQRMQEQRHALSVRNSNASYEGTQLSNEKKRREISGDVNDSDDLGMVRIPAQDPNGDPITFPSRNSVNVNFTTNSSPTYAYDLSNGGVRTTQSGNIQGGVIGFREVPVFKTAKGNSGVVQENFANNNPDKVKWEKVAEVSVRDGSRTKTLLIPAESVKGNLTKQAEEMYKSFNKKSSRGNSATNNNSGLLDNI